MVWTDSRSQKLSGLSSKLGRESTCFKKALVNTKSVMLLAFAAANDPLTKADEISSCNEAKANGEPPIEKPNDKNLQMDSSLAPQAAFKLSI